ncbi:TIM barrel protein [Nocardia sp. CDC159]|uniref:TIM barrel protein n=1 Tax=Nocardia pulmonis TaxID=2951408 RepID=A0A9X2ECA9_9NOCA|nr:MULTISPECIES: TIM barrel protein [Nocardia]MCM6777710.1 TIM barrel protein [Nocardia pulmonis]MCM6790486.1 TIM barrel protein [Nocardia sp. CDC159]
MTREPLPYAVNLSILFTELPLLDRPAAARAAGFEAVEFWWPFATATPDPAEVDAFVRAVDQAGVRLIGLNLFAGDMPGGDRGLVSWPGREQEFADSVGWAVRIGGRLGCRAFNALYGNRIEGVAPAEQDEVALRNLGLAARAIAEIDGTVLLEPVSGMAAYPLKSAADVIGVLDRVRAAQGAANLGLLADLYHLTVNGDDLDEVIARHHDRIAHVQIADAPGRHEPGTGALDIFGYVDKLGAAGYRGHVAAEYVPSGASADSFAWLPTRQGVTP